MLTLRVARVDQAAEGIRSITLRSPVGEPLPGCPPGGHIVVECGERHNAYSLTGFGPGPGPGAGPGSGPGPGAEPEEYAISVLLRPDGAGGSAFVHGLTPGDTVRVSPPHSTFAPVATATRHLLVGGGIGITPLLSHVRDAVEWGKPFELLFAYRPGAGAHLAELRGLCGPRLREFHARADLAADLRVRLAGQPLGTHLYICGPAGLIDTVRHLAAEAGWPAERVHTERFSADLKPGRPFTVRLARSGGRVEVPSGVSLLDALDHAGISVPSLCRQGVCGECRVRVLAGRPQHRDLYLSEDERAAADSILCCVSRGEDEDEELELDL